MNVTSLFPHLGVSIEVYFGLIQFNKFENWMRIFESAHDHLLTLDTYSPVIPSLQDKAARTMDDLTS